MQIVIVFLHRKQSLSNIYYMALACGQYNARSDWLIVTEL